MDDNKSARLGLLLVLIPRDDGQVVRALGPLDAPAEFVSLLELHRKLTFANLVVGEHLEVARETESLHGRDKPLGRIVLVPLDGVTVVHGELVVEVVVAFADGDERGEEVVTRGDLVVERRLTQPVRERVDTEGRVVDKDKTEDSRVKEATAPVTPTETGDHGGEKESHEQKHRDVELVLELDHRVAAQIANVGNTGLAAGLDDHPAKVRPDQTKVRAVRVEIGVGVAVMGAVATSPPVDGALNSAGAHKGQEVLERTGRDISAVCPQTMVT